MGLAGSISDAISGTRSRCFLSDNLDDILLNVVSDDSEDHSVDITSHAIEDGSDIVDNTWQKPVELNLNCVLSDEISDLLSDFSIMAKTKIEDRKLILKNWMDTKTILTLYSWDTDYENMLIESVNYKRSLDTGNGIGLSLALKQVNFVETQIVELGSTDKGKQPLSSSTASGEPKGSSIVYTIKYGT